MFTRGGTRIELVDLPGVYSLLAASPEESIARDEILSGLRERGDPGDGCRSLERNLHLTAQLTEMGVPVVYALNMSDEAEAGLRFDLERLSGLLGGPVATTAATATGWARCWRRRWRPRPAASARAGCITGWTLSRRWRRLPNASRATMRCRRAAGRPLLDGLEDPHAPAGAVETARQEGVRLEKRGGRPVDVQLAEARYGFALGAATEASQSEAHHVRRDRRCGWMPCCCTASGDCRFSWR